MRVWMTVKMKQDVLGGSPDDKVKIKTYMPDFRDVSVGRFLVVSGTTEEALVLANIEEEVKVKLKAKKSITIHEDDSEIVKEHERLGGGNNLQTERYSV